MESTRKPFTILNEPEKLGSLTPLGIHESNDSTKRNIGSPDPLNFSIPFSTEKYPKKLCKYVSGTFSNTERNYPIHELETLACLRTLKKWKIELLTSRLELRTDSKYVTGFWRYKLNADFNKGRLIRWQQQLHYYKPYLKYIKSTNNPLADTLTREWKE